MDDVLGLWNCLSLKVFKGSKKGWKLMSQQTGDPQQAREHSPSLDERIARLRLRRSALTHLIDSLTAYAQYAGQQSDLTYLRRQRHRSGQLSRQLRCGDLGLTRCLEKETPTDAVEPSLPDTLVDGLRPEPRRGFMQGKQERQHA
jgi:hypothetical protein